MFKEHIVINLFTNAMQYMLIDTDLWLFGKVFYAQRESNIASTGRELILIYSISPRPCAVPHSPPARTSHSSLASSSHGDFHRHGTTEEHPDARP